MRKVLIIVHDFPPFGGGAVIRTLKYVKYLKDNGWQPTVLTLKHEYPLVEDKSLLEEIPEDIEVIRTPDTKLMQALGKRRQLSKDNGSEIDTSAPSRRYRILRFIKNIVVSLIYVPDTQAAWLPIAKQTISQMDLKDFDIIYTTAPPFSIGLLGLWIKKRHPKIPWVLDLRDAWIGNSQFTARFFWNRWRCARMEKRILNNADSIITTTKETTDSYKDRYPNISPKFFHTLTNGFDPADFTNNQAHMRTDKFVITFIGSMMKEVRDPRPFLEAVIRILDKNPDFAKNLQINLLGVLDPTNRERFDNPKIKPYVTLFGNRPHIEATEALGNTVINLNILTQASGAERITPGKIYEYFASQRPILALTHEGASARMTREINAGTVINPTDTDQIEAELQRLYKQWKADPDSLLVPAKNIDQYNRKKITSRLAKIFNDLKA
ncbi:glycosyltransferase [Patescibacteria group bacterium]